MTTARITPRGRAALRRAALVVGLLAGVVVGGATAARGQEIAQPAQPKSGPGGSTYRHADWRESSGGSGPDAWFVFEPAQPQPKSAPVAIVMHGYYEFAGYASAYELIRHTVRKGTIVVYPRWQTDIATPCPGPFDIEPCVRSAVHGIEGALAFLRADPGRVQPDLKHGASYFGFSFGGIVTANLANRWASLGLPEPRVVFLDDPHDGGFRGPDEPALDDSLAGIPSRAKVQCHSGQASLSGPDAAVTTCNAVFAKLGHVPKKNKDLVLTYDDAHGTPALSSSHGVCGLSVRGTADAYDWGFCWKVWDALRSCAFRRKDCRAALGPGRKHRAIGTWSDGTPITPLAVKDDVPIGP